MATEAVPPGFSMSGVTESAGIRVATMAMRVVLVTRIRRSGSWAIPPHSIPPMNPGYAMVP